MLLRLFIAVDLLGTSILLHIPHFAPQHGGMYLVITERAFSEVTAPYYMTTTSFAIEHLYSQLLADNQETNKQQNK